jgi:hypothetical protein
MKQVSNIKPLSHPLIYTHQVVAINNTNMAALQSSEVGAILAP